ESFLFHIPLKRILCLYYHYRVSAVLPTIGETAKSNKALIRVNGHSLEKMLVNYKYELKQNYPNPFNPSTKIKYSIKENGLVMLKVYDLLGREIATLVNEPKQAGEYEVEFDASKYDLTSGVYIYELRSGSFKSAKKFVLMK
ncbi:MAG: T9SS type A sorting domain-containing protein, partial [Ignavibacteria bacterium]